MSPESPESVRYGRHKVEVHKMWSSVATLAMVLAFVAYVLTMVFWR